LQEKLSSALVLKFANFTKPFKIHMDVNNFVIRGVLILNGHPIAFENKKNIWNITLMMANSHEKNIHCGLLPQDLATLPKDA
jgi:hypothetical protein